MVELFKKINPNCNMKGDMLRDYHKLIVEFREATGHKLKASSCSSKANMKIIGRYLKMTGKL